jgi:hypothetical protein
MRVIAGSIIAFALLASAASAANAPVAGPGDSVILAHIDDATYDAGFQCPETLASPELAEDDLARFMAWAKLRHPDWNLRKRLDVRYGLLRRHGCAVTLANISSSSQPAFQP